MLFIVELFFNASHTFDLNSLGVSGCKDRHQFTQYFSSAEWHILISLVMFHHSIWHLDSSNEQIIIIFLKLS